MLRYRASTLSVFAHFSSVRLFFLCSPLLSSVRLFFLLFAHFSSYSSYFVFFQRIPGTLA